MPIKITDEKINKKLLEKDNNLKPKNNKSYITSQQ